MHCLLPEEANLKAFSSKNQYYMLYKWEMSTYSKAFSPFNVPEMEVGFLLLYALSQRVWCSLTVCLSWNFNILPFLLSMILFIHLLAIGFMFFNTMCFESFLMTPE